MRGGCSRALGCSAWEPWVGQEAEGEEFSEEVMRAAPEH